jgi:hypothetical protein
MDMTTSIRVTLEDRDRINDLAAEMGMTAVKVLTYLIDEDWKAKAIKSFDDMREQRPEDWAALLADAEYLDRALYTPVEDEPYRSNDPYFLEAGGLPELDDQTKDAA